MQLKCDIDSARNTRPSDRPEGMESDVWNVLRVERQNIAKKAAKQQAAQQKTGPAQTAELVDPPGAGGCFFVAGGLLYRSR